jgi:peptide/nickel transport system permease protein
MSTRVHGGTGPLTPAISARPVIGGLWAGVRAVFSDRSTRAGVLIIVGFVMLAVLAPVAAPYPPLERIYEAGGGLARLEPPSWQHPFGTTNYGRDVLSQVIWGSQRTMSIGVAAAFVTVFLGTNIGLLAGYVGGRTDELLMRLTDAVYAVPFLPFAIVLVAVLGRNSTVLILAIAILFWRTTARVVRSQTLVLKQRSYVRAAMTGGATQRRVMYVHILPNVIPLALLYGMLLTAEAVMAEASLSFLGFAPPNALSWGTIMFDAFTSQELRTAWWWTLFPGLAIMLFVLAISLIGRGYERRLQAAMGGGR